MNAQLEEAFRAHNRLLFGVCYRMTGCAADAEDLVQDTYARALERPPRHLDRPLRPWLVRVATNLALDHLRRRRRTTYTVPWLPSPLPEELDDPVESAECRYERAESATFAFLLALEVLTPQQRAVLLLRDVYGYTVRETADALSLSEANVKTTLHRARRALAGYDEQRCRPDSALIERHRDAIARFTNCLAEGDERGLAALMAPDVQLLTDGGGEFVAALRPILGADRVTRFFRAHGALLEAAPPGRAAQPERPARHALRVRAGPVPAGRSPLRGPLRGRRLEPHRRHPHRDGLEKAQRDFVCFELSTS